MKTIHLLKRFFVSLLIGTELLTSTVYAADMSDTAVYENQEEPTENNVVEQPAVVQPPQAMSDVMAELNAKGSTSINAVDLLGDNPSINISVPNNAVQQSDIEPETTVETELVQRDLVYKRKDVTITATGLLPKDATLELVESNKITDLVQYKGDTETRKLYDTLFNYNIKINNKGTDFVPTESIKWVFESPLIKATTPDGKDLSLGFVKVLGKEKVKNTEVEKLEKINSTIQEGKIEFSAKELGNYALVTTLKDEIELVNKTINITLKDGSKITITGMMPEDSEIEAFVVEKPSLNTKTLADGSQIVEVYKTYDIKIKSNRFGYYQPKDYGKTVKVTINSKDIKSQNTTKASTSTEQNETVLLHTDDKGNTDEVETANIKEGTVSFTANSFSEFSLAGTKSIGNYIVFSSAVSFTLKTSNSRKNWNGTIEYSLNNGSTWTVWDGKVINVENKILYLRGKTNTKIAGSSSYNWVLSCNSDHTISCSGNLENLLDYSTVQQGKHPTMAKSCFAYMFYRCTSLEQAPELPAITLANYCYYEMFSGCKKLEYSPELPATVLKLDCYADMFKDCISLKQVANLPATNLAWSCYYNMFSGCTSLETAPELPATILIEHCYEGMFSGCNSLTQCPNLPATTLANYCYASMFYGCTSLEQAPELPATTLAQYCYEAMFSGCTSLEQAPELPATTLAKACCKYMFRDCTNLIQAPELPATTLAEDCYYYMFYRCTSLERSPTELPATTLTKYCYANMFKDCSSLRTLPKLPAIKLVSYCYYGMFENCINLRIFKNRRAYAIKEYNFPSGLNGDTSIATNSYYYMFKNTGGDVTEALFNSVYYLMDDSIDVQSESIVASKSSAICFSSDTAFTLKTKKEQKTWNGFLYYSLDDANTWVEWTGQTISVEAGKELFLLGRYNTFLTCDNTGSYYAWQLEGTEINCVGNIENLLDFRDVLIGQEPMMGHSCFREMFSNCKSLIQAPDLSATVLTYYCYYSMFAKCSNLRQVHRLCATQTDSFCCSYMFSYCTSLEYAPELPATTLAEYCYYQMFRCCTDLKQAPELPATELAKYCYANMFFDCTSLEQAPELPATTLAEDCYSGMFMGCTSLEQAPELSATELAKYCYASMFFDCSSLEQAPELPATTVLNRCYMSMFRGCTSLKHAPSLSALTLATDCYLNMFNGCTSLEQAPELPATTLADGCYMSMFRGCTSLEHAPSLPATVLASQCYYEMFMGCTDLRYLPKLESIQLADNCYNYMFFGCSAIKLAKEKAGLYTNFFRIQTTDSSVSNTSADVTYGMFGSTGGLFTGTPLINTTYYVALDGVTETTTLSNSLDYALKFSSDYDFVLEAWYDWEGIMEYSMDEGSTWNEWDGSKLEATAEQAIYLRGSSNLRLSECNSGSGAWYCTGQYCTGNIETLLDYKTVAKHQHPIMGDNCFTWMFTGFTSLEEPPELPSTTLAPYCYDNMFCECYTLKQAPELPATTLTEGCYKEMFYNCTSLEQAPKLPATTLAEGCYRSMFSGCENLIQIPELPATTLAEGCYDSMFEYCSNLKVSEIQEDDYQEEFIIISDVDEYPYDVCSSMFGSTGGTFTDTPELNTSYYLELPPIESHSLMHSYFITLPASLSLLPSEQSDIFVSDFTVKAKAADGLGKKYIKVVPNSTAELTNEADNSKVTLNIAQQKHYFGKRIGNNIVEEVIATDWSEIKGNVKAEIHNQGVYKGNFEFTYGLVDSIE